MRWSSPSWWDEPLHLELAEIMDDLDDGWTGSPAWRETPEPAQIG